MSEEVKQEGEFKIKRPKKFTDQPEDIKVDLTKKQEDAVQESEPTKVVLQSNEEKKEYKYRRVVLYDLTDAGEQAFLANQKFWIDADQKLGVDYLYALMKPVFATDADYMLVLLDKSRFDYHKNWEDRMEKRFSDKDFQANYEKIEKSPVSSIVEEWNLNLLEEYIY